MFNDSKYMEIAIKQAKLSYSKGEVPIGAIIVDNNGEIIAESHNLTESLQDPTSHAEMLAIKLATQKLKNKNLSNYSIYVSLEPCPMCAQAISFARFKKLVYSASDLKGGGVEGATKIYEAKSCFHKPEIISGILEEESATLLRNFFRSKR